MKKLILILMFALFLMSSVSAVQYWQQRYFKGNDTTQIHSAFEWTGSILTDDYIKSGNKLQSYVLYNIYPAKWNAENINYSVEYCNISIIYYGNLDNSTTEIFTQTYTDETNDDLNAKYFVEVEEGGGYFTDIYCKFSGTRPVGLETPADFTIVTPTWECKECQYYEWTLLQRDIDKAETIGQRTNQVYIYISNFIEQQFEIWLVIFWVFLIFLAFASTSLVFIGIYWIYLFLSGLAK